MKIKDFLKTELEKIKLYMASEGNVHPYISLNITDESQRVLVLDLAKTYGDFNDSHHIHYLFEEVVVDKMQDLIDPQEFRADADSSKTERAVPITGRATGFGGPGFSVWSCTGAVVSVAPGLLSTVMARSVRSFSSSAMWTWI